MKRIATFICLCFLLHSSFALAEEALLLFGGSDHRTFLGCLNCDSNSQSSIWNPYGKYGSPYNSESIWNKYGNYGSEYSSYSPWNKYTSTPPIVVDRSGKSYGYLTINEYKSPRANFSLAIILYKYHDSIADDVTSWYDKIFK